MWLWSTPRWTCGSQPFKRRDCCTNVAHTTRAPRGSRQEEGREWLDAAGAVAAGEASAAGVATMLAVEMETADMIAQASVVRLNRVRTLFLTVSGFLTVPKHCQDAVVSSQPLNRHCALCAPVASPSWTGVGWCIVDGSDQKSGVTPVERFHNHLCHLRFCTTCSVGVSFVTGLYVSGLQYQQWSQMYVLIIVC